LNLERSHVRAPFAGGITERLASRGDFLKVGEPIFRLVDDASLKFTFQVPERFGSKVSPGLDVALSVDNFPGETFRGSVQLISPAVNTVSRAFDVAARVENPALRLKANSFARGSLVLERGVNVPVIPLESVITFAGVTKVFVLENGTARARTVVTGRIRDGMQEIISGVAAGDAVITSGQSRLGDGAAVTLRSPAPAKP
jgi:membrane fusion protein (multidrug efflux system)